MDAAYGVDKLMPVRRYISRTIPTAIISTSLKRQRHAAGALTYASSNLGRVTWTLILAWQLHY